MRISWRYLFLGIILSIVLVFFSRVFPKIPGAEVLSAMYVAPTATPTLTPTPTPSPTSTPTPTPRPTNTPTPKPTSTPTPTLTPTPTQPPTSSQDINGFIDKYAAHYSVDPNGLRHIAVCESGMNPNATNGPYVGLYQFAASTWSNNRNVMGEDPNPALRTNAEESIQTAAFLLSTKGSGLWPNCKPT